MSEIAHRTVAANGISIHIAEQGEGPAVLLLHGFPELWYSWRWQLPALAAAGFHAIAPDVRGYGRTDAPQPLEAYSMRNMTADAIGILDALGIERATVVGHDWGSPIAWHCALLHPKRFSAVAALSVPFTPRGKSPPVEALRHIFAGRFFYIIYFQEPGVAEKELEADVRRSLLSSLWAWSGDAPESAATPSKSENATLFDERSAPQQPPTWISESDLDYYVSEFERTGFRGGLNRYRNMDRDWEDLTELTDAVVQQPALFVVGERDPTLRFTSVEPMKTHVSELKKTVVLPGCGHWTQQERPSEVNRELIAFLQSLAHSER